MLRLCTFGSVDLGGPPTGDLSAVLAQPKRLALLVYLAAARPFGVHRRDELLALFWPDLDDTRARDALNQALRFLRQSLGPEVFVRRGGEDVGIDPARLWCDAAAFQEALEAGRPAEALELYRGDFLQGFFIEEGGGFEEWMERERTAHRESAGRGARQLAETHASEGALTLAIDWGRRALEFAPDDERALRRLLRWHDRAGDRAGAFRAYEAFARRFEKEFGSEPSEETRELIEKLKAGQPLTEERVAARPVAESPRSFGKDPAAELGNRYRIVRRLGAGGMATVYLAQDVKHDREVALKVLRPEISEGLARERFIREIRIAGRLQHPNIVPLFDSGVADERLYYVMAHIEGETLRDRLTREGRFEVSLVQHILREIAGALAYAHDRGVIHRDIKPENILLIDRRAVLTDFGIARAAHAARTPAGVFDQTLTQPGTSLGTPAYMAPEQAAGNPEVDQRADLYALGVLGYEMLAGRTPFVGTSAQQILMAQMLESPAPIGALRPDTPPALGALVMRCLEKKPARRPASAQEFLAEVDGRGPGATRVPWSRRRGSRRWMGAAAGLLLLGLLGMLLPRSFSTRARPLGFATASADNADSDTSRYAILPFERDFSVPTGIPVEQFMQDAFARWEGIRLVDRFRINDAMRRRDSTRLTTAGAGELAATVGSGRYVRGEVTPIGDSLRIHAGLYDLGRGSTLIADGTVRVSRSLLYADSAFAALADALLFQNLEAGPGYRSTGGTRSFPARQAFGRGQAAVGEWDLPRADSGFVQATRHDPSYVEAFLWLAQVRYWQGLPEVTWSAAADRANVGRTRLSPRDRVLSDAMTALAAGDSPTGCSLLIDLGKASSLDFAAWYSIGTCLARDSLVVPDPRSVSSWAFRSSYGEALDAFVQSFKLLPSIHRSLRDRGFEPVRALFKTSTRYPRPGVGAGPARQRFLALPTWEGDSLAFVPRPASEFLRPGPGLIPARVREALERQREQFHRVATAWAADNGNSPYAMEALALSLELLANPASIDTLRRARRLMASEPDRLRLAAAEVWLRLKLSVPADLAGMQAARWLADSLLGEGNSAGERSPALLVGLAVLTGRARLAAELARKVPPESFLGVPPQIARTAAPLLALAVLGGPDERLQELFAEVSRDIERLPQPALREQAYLQWVVRPATLALLPVPPAWFSRLEPRGDYLLEAQQSLIRGDSAAVRRTLDGVGQAKLILPPEDLGLDAVYPEAQLLAGLGDLRGAIAWLDPVLAALSRAAPQVASDPAPLGSLVRASALRARLAAQVGDLAGARRWSRVVAVLWSDADPFLRPMVEEMRRLAR